MIILRLATAALGAPRDLNRSWDGIKRYPCCATTHRALDTTLDLIEMHRLGPDAVGAVECAVH